MKEMTQTERLDYLVEQFKLDSIEYKDLKTPEDPEMKRRLLRSLMNIRMPKILPPIVIRIQDEYLQERNREKGIVEISDIHTVKESGSTHPFAEKISVWQGDITRLAADAIVNAANSQMLGCFVPMHTCIDNSIHTYAGVELRSECERQMRVLRAEYGQDYEQPTAVPMLTDAYNLPADKVIHVVGPIVMDRVNEQLEQQLADCYRNSLDLCLKNNLRSIAFCCISTGVFRFPNRLAATIAVNTVTKWLKNHPDQMDRIIFNVFKDEDRKYYEQELFETA